MFNFNRTSPQLETLRNTSAPRPDLKSPKSEVKKSGDPYSFGDIRALILFLKKWITFVPARRLNNLVLLVGYFLK